MAISPTAPERIDLSRADDPRDIVHRAVACLAQGGVVGLPTDSGYGLAAGALATDAVGRLLGSVGGPLEAPALGLRGGQELADWVPDLSLVGRRLARRGWPGPLTLVADGATDRGLARRLPGPVLAAVRDPGGLRVRVPSHPAILEVLRLISGPLILADLRGDGPAGLGGADALLGLPGVDMVLDDGPPPHPGPTTVVRVGPEGWDVVRPGAVSPEALTRMAGMILLFVCTGNTCRSPMAEALCKALLAERLGCTPADLEARGYVVLSAGMAAASGQPAAAHAVEVVKARGGSLQGHASRRISAELAERADLIIAMTRDHLDTLLAHLPEVAPRARLLHPRGGDVDDPVGADRETYRRTADEIADYLGLLLDEMGIP